MKNTGGSFIDSQSVNLTEDAYYGGQFMLAFDRTKSRDNRFRRTVPDSGTISINLKLASPLEENIVVVIYSTYTSQLDLNQEEVTTTTF